MTTCPLCGYVGGGYVRESETLAELKRWLEHHEREIADPGQWSDLGLLRNVFQAVIGREAGDQTCHLQAQGGTKAASVGSG